jgi:hypothetical protein
VEKSSEQIATQKVQSPDECGVVLWYEPWFKVGLYFLRTMVLGHYWFFDFSELWVKGPYQCWVVLESSHGSRPGSHSENQLT